MPDTHAQDTLSAARALMRAAFEEGCTDITLSLDRGGKLTVSAKAPPADDLERTMDEIRETRKSADKATTPPAEGDKSTSGPPYTMSDLRDQVFEHFNWPPWCQHCDQPLRGAALLSHLDATRSLHPKAQTDQI